MVDLPVRDNIVKPNTRIRSLLAMVLGATVAGWSTASWSQSSGPLSSAKVVYVGHSLINYDMPDMVKSIAASKGVSYSHAVQVNNGTNIRNNWQGCRESSFSGEYKPLEFACDAIEGASGASAYDTLIVTQVNNPIVDPSNPNNYGSSPEDFDNFLDLLLSRNSSGKAYFYTSWEGLGSQWHNGQEWTTRIANELSYYERLVARIEEVHRAHGTNIDVQIIPADIALREFVLAAESGAISGIGSRTQIFKDDVHMNNTGNYFMACVVYSTIYRQSPVGASGRTVNRWGAELTNLGAETARQLQELAWRVVSEYRGQIVNSRPRSPTSLSVQ